MASCVPMSMLTELYCEISATYSDENNKFGLALDRKALAITGQDPECFTGLYFHSANTHFLLRI